MEEYKTQGGYVRLEEDGVFIKHLRGKQKVLYSDIKSIDSIGPSSPKIGDGELNLNEDVKRHTFFFNGTQSDGVKKVYDAVINNANCVDLEKEKISFTPTKTVSNFIEVDEKNKKVAFIPRSISWGNPRRVVDYKDIIDFEVIQDNESIVKGGLGSAIVGGALFGDTGAIVGGITGRRKIAAVVQKLDLIVRINDMENPLIQMSFIKKSVERNSYTYSSILKEVQEALSVLSIIVNDNSEISADVPPTIQNNVGSAADEILKYKQLLDMGVITQEEFEAKKKQLLNL